MKELRIFRITDAGPKDNEDSCFVSQYGTAAAIACMADGVSSQAEAGHTSGFITDYVEDWYEEEGSIVFKSDPDTVAEKMLELVNSIHSDLLIKAEEEGFYGYGSTMDLVVIGNSTMFITHVGDSRVYLFDGKNINKITVDQTVEEAEKATGFKYDDVEESRKAHMLLQCIGSGEINPYQYRVAIPATCDILLCSDGLTNRLTDHDLTTELRKKQTGSAALLNLVKKARDKGEGDNITAILIRRRDMDEKKAKSQKRPG